jgi:hypothetical protein
VGAAAAGAATARRSDVVAANRRTAARTPHGAERIGYNRGMPTYIMLSTLTPEGVQTVKNNPARIREVY